MSARESLKTAAFVLRCLNYGESDLIVSFYSSDFGKIKGIAKGAKRSKKRFANVLEPFSLTSVIFTRKSRDTLAFIDSCEIINHYDAIRKDLENTLIASYFLELTDCFSPEGKKNEPLFELLQSFLGLLCVQKGSDALIRFFEMRLLKAAGFEPALEGCIMCQMPVANGGTYYFHAPDGGIKCAKCTQPERYGQSVSAGTIRTLLLGKDMDIDKIRLVAMADPLAREASHLLTGFITHILNREVKSFKVMEQVRKFHP